MKTVQLVAALLLGCVLGVQAETTNPKVDSLKRLLQSRQPIDKAEVLWSIAYELFDVDNPQAVFYAERAYHEVWAKGDSLQIVKVGTTYGQLLRRVGKVQMSIEISSRLLPVSKRHNYRKYTKMLLNSLQMAYVYAEDYAKSLEMAYESLSIRKMDGDRHEIAIGIGNLGFLLYKICDYESSIEKSKEVLSLLGSSCQEEVCINAVLNIGVCYMEMRNYYEANSWFRKAVEMDKKAELPPAAQARQSFAQALSKVGEVDSAFYYARAAKFISSRKMDFTVFTASCLTLASLAMANGDLIEAGSQIKQADSAISRVPHIQLQNSVRLHKARFYVHSGNAAMAFRLYERHFDVADSLEDFRISSSIRELHVAYAQKENEMKIKNQAGLMALQKESIGIQRQYILIVTLLLVLVAALTIKLYRANERKRVINRLLDERIVERTRELGDQRYELKHNLDEHNIVNSRVSSSLISLVNTLQGLLHLAKIDQPSNYKTHIGQAVSIAAKIDELARNLSHGRVLRK